jgi:UDP-N-acetylglucosamine--N-acetylmuramyl-(pentapeptide) pyrophosphoryl-undecaprenol N-acetylglucosamine transferase
MAADANRAGKGEDVGEKSVMLAAGGTGGHLFPAFALAEELGRRGIAVDLVTDARGDRYGTGFPARAIHAVPSATLAARSVGAVAKTGLALMSGVRAAYALLGRVKPDAVIGFGGYPTFPPLVAAKLRRIPTAIHEANAVLGRANKMLAPRVSRIATSFEKTALLADKLASKVRFTGNPVRDVVIDWSARPYRVAEPHEPFNLLVFGGSQGARYFSEALPPAIALLGANQRTRLRIVQQCREEDLAEVRATYDAAGVTADLATFFKDLPERMAGAQLVIGRAGASTIAELTVLGRPSVLVPLPNAIDNDQLRNATRLAEAGAGWCLEQKHMTSEKLAETIGFLMQRTEALSAAADAAKRLGRPDAVVRLADLAEELIGVRPPNRA